MSATKEEAKQSPTAKMLGKSGGKKAAEPKTEESPVQETTNEEPEAKAQQETKIPTKTAKKSEAKTPEVLGKDLIAEASQEIETLKKEEALKMAKELIDQADFNYFKLGGVLSVIQANEWWKGMGYEKFQNFMSTEYNMPYRKGMYLVQIYNGLVEAQVPWEKVKALGWTKLKELSGILTLDNVDEWVKTASKLSTIQLIEYIKQQNAPEPGSTAPTSVSEITTVTFKVHEDQRQTINDALDKAKSESNTDVNTVALEHICMSYLEGKLGKKTVSPKFDPKTADLSEIFHTRTPEEIMEVFEKVFPDLDVTIKM